MQNIKINSTSTPYLTVQQLNAACQNNKFLLLRFKSGYQMGINCKVAGIVRKRKMYNDSELTEFVSYKPCGIAEYIEHKHPFFTSTN